MSEEVATEATEATVEEVAEVVAEETPEEEVTENVAPATEEVAQEPPPDFSKQFSAIAKKERSLRKREEALKGLEARIKELESGSGQLSEIQKMAAENPAALLGRLGINYDELTQQVINEGAPTPEQGLKLENSKLRERLEKLESVYESQQEESKRIKMDKARNTLIDNVKTFIDNDDQYELVKHEGAYELVAEIMQAHFIKNEEIMPYSDAARIAENHFEAESERFLGSKKVQEKWRAKYQHAEEAEETQAPADTGGPKTLSNKHAAQKTEPLTGLEPKEESLRRIAQMIRWGE